MKILENVVIKDKEGLFRKIKNIKEDGLESLHIVTDFDKTLNKEFTSSGKFKSLISLIRDGGFLENDYPNKANALYDKYHPIEIDLSMPYDIKKEKMKEWWTTHIKLISLSKMHKDFIEKIILKSNMEFREKVSVFLNILSKKNIPTLIFSSGLGDFISYSLEKENLLFSNIHVISNFFDWDENGFAKPYYKGDKVIHILNKDETEIKDTPYFLKIKDRKNVILLGDSLEDIKMISGLKYKNIISIGFLNSDVENKLETYKNIFDVIILNDGSFMQVLEILNEIISD
jgi:cytosolic 5'-nucleotidase 3